jgi:endonuclease/exonuclease/phosphatase family metal-dependent hydrolase
VSLIRLMTYNVHHCRGMDGVLSPERVTAVIASCRPDIVALQELDVGRARTGWVDQPRLIGGMLDMDFHFHPTLEVAEERYGTAVLSRWPLRLRRAELLPTLRGRRLENRGALWVEVGVNGRALQLVNTHLGLTRGERRLQAASLLGSEWLAHPECREPRVLCGDFNMTGRGEYTCFDGVCVRSRWSQLGPPPRTWPSLLPVLALDHVFFSEGVALDGVDVPGDLRARLASDHRPVVATFRI